MKVDKRFHCFACQADGDAVDFVSRLFGLPSKAAAMKLADDFGISYDNRQKHRIKPHTREPTPEQRYRQEESRCYKVLSDYFHHLRTWKQQYAPKQPEDEWHPLFVEAISNICWMFFCMAQLRKRGLWLLKLMDEEEVAEFTKPVEETKPEVVETVPEITEPAPEEKPKSTNMLPAILTLIVLPVVVDSSYLRKSRKRRRYRKRQSLTQMLIMWTMTRTMGTIRSLRTMMKIVPSMKMIMNLCKQDRLDAWGSLRVAFT